MKTNMKLNCSSQFIILLFLILLGSLKGFAQDANEVLKKVDKHFFIENKGQWDSKVLFMTKLNGLNFWITKTGVVYDFYEMTKSKSVQSNDFKGSKLNPVKVSGHALMLNMKDINSDLISSGEAKLEAYYNYIKGNDKGMSASNVGLYRKAIVKNVYNKVDERYYFDENSIRYDYIVNPGGKVADIEFAIEGTDKKYINDGGELVFETRFGQAKQAKLFTYQIIEGEKKEIESHFKLSLNGNITFDIGTYDPNYPLIIDPLLYSSYIGGSDDEQGVSIALDASNNSYIAGGTWSPTFPQLPGIYTFGGLADGFVSKINTSLTGVPSLIYSTFIGGSNHEWFYSIDVDPMSQIAYVTGQTLSTDYPTINPIYASNQGVQDGIVSIVNATGTALFYSTYLGGLQLETSYGIVIDPTAASGSLKDCYVTGATGSANYPWTSLAYDISFNGDYDVFVTKVNPNISGIGGILYSTFLGSSDDEWATSITLDANKDVYITGTTRSPLFPATTIGTLFTGKNVFVTKLKTDLSSLLYSSRFGSSMDDIGNSIVLNGMEAVITGNTSGANFPTNAGTPFGGGGGDIFVTRINSTGNLILNSRFLGGNMYEEGTDIACSGGNVYITGFSFSADYPVTRCAYDEIFNGVGDAVVTKLSLDLNTILYSTYLGSIFIGTTPGTSTSLQGGQSLAVDPIGLVHVSGLTGSSNFPVVNAFDPTFNGSQDVFVSKLDMYPNNSPCSNGAPAMPITLTNTNPGPSALGFQMTGNITTNGVVGFYNLNIAVLGNYSIVVNSGVLTITGTHISTCNNMWRGITVMPGARLVINGNSLIEDAITAVYVPNAIGVGSILDINTAIFNKNAKAIRIENYDPIIPTYPFSIKNSVFTSRELTKDCFAWPDWWSVSDLKTTTTPANNLMTPYDMQGAPFIALKNLDIRPTTHIELINVGQTTFSGSVATYYEAYIGGNINKELNLFDNSNWGIDAINSNFATVNAVFQNMRELPLIKLDGVAVRAQKISSMAKQTTPKQLRIRCEPVAGDISLNNKFYDCFRGIESTDYYAHELNYNHMYSLQTTGLLSAPGIIPEVNLNDVGRIAIDVLTSGYENININDNYIANHTMGIHQVSGTLTAGAQISLGARKINNNLLVNRPVGNPLATTFLGDAIVVELVNGTNPVSGPSTWFLNNLDDNVIVNAYRGISYFNFAYKYLINIIHHNTITLQQDFYPAHGQNGILTYLNLWLFENENTCTGAGFAHPAQNQNTSFASVLNTGQILHCNLSMNNYAGFKFFATNAATDWMINSMDHGHYWGLSLDFNGIIGPQGSPSDAIDNQWLGLFADGHTNVSGGSNAAASVLFVRGSGLPFTPNLNTGFLPLNYDVPGNLQLATLPANPKECQEGGDFFIPSEVIGMMEDIIQDSLVYGSNIEENRWMAKQNVYKWLKYDSSYTSATPILDSFYNNPPQGIKSVQDIEDQIQTGDFTTAQALVIAFNPANTIEANYKHYYDLFLHYVQTGNWTSSDSDELLTLAHKCIFTDGPVVVNARTFYNSLYREQYTVFKEDCVQEEEGNGIGGAGNKGIAFTEQFAVEIFPNPTSKSFNLKSNCNDNCAVSIIMRNLSGATILMKSCDLQQGNCFENTSIAAGTYFVTIIKESTKESVIKKLIITNQ